MGRSWTDRRTDGQTWGSPDTLPFARCTVVASSFTCHCVVKPGIILKIDPQFLIVRAKGDFYATNAANRFLNPFVTLRTATLQPLWELCCKPTCLCHIEPHDLTGSVAAMVENTLLALMCLLPLFFIQVLTRFSSRLRTPASGKVATTVPTCTASSSSLA
ncbi:hypothetical protein K438DRAFT_1969508 [Mycena galopus ATCC 62051]|nr:hypothetical protein K438DRAFT_1969508 [Mycena galopus ATCC 62051]